MMESAPIESTHIGDDYTQNRNSETLLHELSVVVAENEDLKTKLNELFTEKLRCSKMTVNAFHNMKELEDYKKKVYELTKERNSLQTLWHTAQKTIEALENELKTYQQYVGSKPKEQNLSEINYELQLKLESSMGDYIELEGKYKHLKQKQTVLEQKINAKDTEVKCYKDKNKDLDEQIDELKREVEKCNIDLGVEKKNCEDLRSQLSLYQKECVGYIRKEAEAKSKVAEALQLYDVVNKQKSEAFQNILDMTAEIIQLREEKSNIKSATEKHYRQIIDELKDKYNEKVSDMLAHIRNLDAELIEKGLLLNKLLRENKVLQISNEEYIQDKKNTFKSIDPKLSLAEQRIQSMFDELVSSERKNIQLICEKQSLAIDMQRLQDLFKRETKKRDWEESLLKTENEELRLQLEHMQKSLDDTHAMVAKLHNVLSSKSELNLRVATSKQEELLELNNHLENQIQLNKKWKDSYVEMCGKLKQRLKEVYEENKSLRIKLDIPFDDSNDSSLTSICS